MKKKEQKLRLRDFQKQDVLFLRKHNYRVLVANGQGTGKTIECLAAIALDRRKLCPVIVVCPASVVWNWHREGRKWCKWARIHVIGDRTTPLPKQRCHIYIVSWSLLPERTVEIARKKPQLLIADEAHFAKNIETQRYQSLYALTKVIPCLLLLTGTPLINKVNELETLNQLFGTKKPPMLRRLLSDVAKDIPPKTRMLLRVYLRPRTAIQYRKAVEEFADWLKESLKKRMDDGEAEAAARRALAAEALVKVGYLRRLVGKGKVYAASDWVARAVRVGEQVVLFAEHTEVIRRLKLLLKKQRISYVVVDGSTPKTARQTAIDSFQNGDVAVFMGSKAAITGITLTKARHVCFVERFWTSAEEEQGEDRIRRISQQHPTKIWYLHATGTIDDRIDQIIRRKRRMIAAHIGSEKIEESPEENVLALITDWSKQASAEIHKGDPMLGLVKSLPALPKPSDTHLVVFKGGKANLETIKNWSKMNGYTLKSTKKTGKKYKCLVNPVTIFRANSFTTFHISKEIVMVVGKRRKRVGKNEIRKKVLPQRNVRKLAPPLRVG